MSSKLNQLFSRSSSSLGNFLTIRKKRASSNSLPWFCFLSKSTKTVNTGKDVAVVIPVLTFEFLCQALCKEAARIILMS